MHDLGADVRALGERGFFVRDAVLGIETARAMAIAARASIADGALTPAGVGSEQRILADVRGDETAWIDGPVLQDRFAPLLAAFTALADDLRREAYLGLARHQVQLARYRPGAAYARHVDALTDRSGRRVTMIYYLNEGWHPADDGALRLWSGADAINVWPELDRMVVLLADRVPHEVQTTRRERIAVSAFCYGPG